MNSIITVGITGGIGAGKTLVCRCLNIMGYPVFYSDQEAKALLSEDKIAIQEVTSLLGAAAYTKNIPNRGYIAQEVFQDARKLAALNTILHPKVREKFEHWKTKQNSQLVFNEAAILFETGAYKNFTKNLLVVAPKKLRIERILQRDKSSVQEIEKRMSNQWTDIKKIKLADFIVENNDEKAILPQLEIILISLLNER